MVDAPPGFPFEWAYPGQVTAVKDIREFDNVLLSSATGSGKTAVFLSATFGGKPALVVEPRKFLQQQVGDYRKDYVIFGRSGYPCHFEDTAADAPCRGKKESYSLGDDIVKCFRVFDEKTGREALIRYPCPEGCPYMSAVKGALETIKRGGTVIANFGNFWPYLKDAEVVIIDEADLFFTSISSGKRLRHISNLYPTTEETIAKEIQGAKADYDALMKVRPHGKDEGRSVSRRIDKSKNHYLMMQGLLANADICFQYKQYDKSSNKNNFYVEIRPDKVNILKDRMFPSVMENGKKRKVVIATATPGNFVADKVISYSVFMRTAFFYAPVALMTASNMAKHPEVMEMCANFIRTTHEGFKKLDGGKKTLVHCGSLAYARMLGDLLGTRNCDIHTTGKLMEIIEGFKTSEQEYLLVTAAEYGANIDYASHQYVLKVPYASFNERLQCLQSEMGQVKFDEWYSLDAMYRVVQQSGRVGRGAGGTGFTFMLDRKYGELYGRYGQKMPVAFNELVQRGGTL